MKIAIPFVRSFSHIRVSFFFTGVNAVHVVIGFLRVTGRIDSGLILNFGISGKQICSLAILQEK